MPTQVRPANARQFFSRQGTLSKWHPNYEFRPGQVEMAEAVESALEMGSSDAGAVRYLLTAEDLERPQPELLDVGVLSRYERPLPVLAGYDELLSAEDIQ